MAALVADRAVDHAFVGLFQYAAIRVGAERAEAAIAGLVSLPTSRDDHSDDRAEPGPRAALYKELRGTLSALPSTPLPARAPQWWNVAPAHEASYVALRAALTGPDAEVAELRFARRLDDEEVAYVIEGGVDEVRAAASRALAAARVVFGARPPSLDGTHAGALLEAYALDPTRVPTPKRSTREPVLSVGTVVGERYEVRSLLGAGAFADVYEARDCEVTGHVVALKILRARSVDARSVRSALRELQLIASVFHPSVVQLKDHGWHDSHLWFVMPLYRGETLATRLERGPLSRADAREIFEQLAEALATMHDAGVRHQDIKPENVFLADLEHERGTPDEPGARARILPVLLDLGVAAKDAELVLAGTPAYFAPEVAARFAHVPDPPPVGPKADVFSLALTLRQALDPQPHAHLPGGAVDAFIAHRAICAPRAPASSDLADLRPAFERWLASSPDRRPTAVVFRRELGELTRPAERRARAVRALRWVLPVAAVVLSVFVAVVGDLSRQADLSRAEATRAGEQAARARERAHTISQSLSESAARRAELEANVAHLEQEYQTSRMTREQLASRLARADGELALLGERERMQASRARQHLEAIAGLERTQTQLERRVSAGEQQLADTTDALSRERSRAAEASRLSEQLASTRRELDAAAERNAQLEARVRLLQAPSQRHELPTLDAYAHDAPP